MIETKSPTPIEWATKPFHAAVYVVYDPRRGGRLVYWGYTQHQLAVWCFSYDPSNDAETAETWESPDWLEENDE